MTIPTRRIGRFRIEDVIGTGAFATVHRAVDDNLGDTVAVKVLADNHCLDPDIRQRFIAEGRILRRIDSRHVVRVHDMGETETQQPFLVLEYADRGTLSSRVADLRSGGWEPGPDDIRVVARSLAAAVEALHRVDVVHRDLSPGNVLLRSTAEPGKGPASSVVGADERLVLSDLGLCKDLAIHSGLTISTGTEGFRPPEQRGGPARIDPRADLWALSALMVWLATGSPPGDRSVRTAVSRAGLPARLGEVLSVSLSVKPEKRHRNVATWLGDVEAALSEPATPPSEPERSSLPAARSSRRVSLAWLGSALVLGALLGAGAALILDSDSAALVRLEDGRVEVAAQAGSSRLALVGPPQVVVGDVAVFEARTNEVDRWVWLMPDGAVFLDTAEIQLRTHSVGMAQITLLGVASSGERLEVTHELQVVGG